MRAAASLRASASASVGRSPRDRDDRLLDAAGRLEDNLQVEIAANQAYDIWRREGSTRYRNSRRSPGGPTNSWEPPVLPDGRINTTDPDSRLMRAQGTTIQGYNAQAAVTADQIIVAAEVTLDPGDFTHLEPMVDATRSELGSVGIAALPEVIVADAGYWHTLQMNRLAEAGFEVLVPPDGGARKGTGPAGTTSATNRCATNSQPTAASSSTGSARPPSSPCSVRSSSTAGSTGSYEEADPRRGRNGVWRQQHTICSSFTATGSANTA